MNSHTETMMYLYKYQIHVSKIPKLHQADNIQRQKHARNQKKMLHESMSDGVSPLVCFMYSGLLIQNAWVCFPKYCSILLQCEHFPR